MADTTTLTDEALTDVELADRLSGLVNFVGVHGVSPAALKEAARRLRARGTCATCRKNTETPLCRGNVRRPILMHALPVEFGCTLYTPKDTPDAEHS